MTGKTHQVAGQVAGLGYFLFSHSPSYNPASFAAVLVGASLGALLPDIDQPAGVLWEKIPLLGHTAGKVTSRAFFGHRNLTHSVLGALLFGLLIHYLVFLFPSYWGIDQSALFISTMIAYGAHLLLDSITVEGIPLLFPWQRNFGFPPKPLDGIRVMTGKWFENLVLFPLFDLTLIVFIVVNWQKIKQTLFK